MTAQCSLVNDLNNSNPTQKCVFKNVSYNNFFRLDQLYSNVKLVADATKLPIVDPLNSDQLESHTDVALSCFCASISVTVAIAVVDTGELVLRRHCS